MGVENMRVEPVDFYWGKDIFQSQKVACVADDTSSLNDKYFMLYDAANLPFYVWLNVATAGSDPSIANMTGIEVAVAEDASATVVAAAVAAAIDLKTEFGATSSADIVTITLAVKGMAYPSHEPEAINGPAFTHYVEEYGFEELNIGCIDGDIEFSVEKTEAELTCHQMGTDVLGGITTGKSVEMTVNWKETAIENIQKLFIKAQNDYVMSLETVSTAAVGVGTRRNFQNNFGIAMPVRLHPRRLVDADKSEDYYFWKAMPRMESLTFSGENVRTVPTVYKIYPDESEGRKMSYFIVGDYSKFVS
jgi:hypothetical protein